MLKTENRVETIEEEEKTILEKVIDDLSGPMYKYLFMEYEEETSNKEEVEV